MFFLTTQFLAVMCSGLFAGAALYVTLVEHPARMECGTVLAATEFSPSYRRAAVLQACLAAISFLAAIAAWLESSNELWLVGAILIVAVIPFTLLVILPTNKKLLDSSLDRGSEMTRTLLVRWGRLHAVRSVLGLLAFCVLILAMPPRSQKKLSGRPAGDSVTGAMHSSCLATYPPI